MTDRVITLLVAALGGEGGGLLTDWIVKAAAACDLPVQSTSIPGVAQRTGATTYYVEVFPKTNAELKGRRPLLALSPCPGSVDAVIATELLEAGRAVENGFVSPKRTALVAVVRRVYSINEKSNMADGRYSEAELLRVLTNAAKHRSFVDASNPKLQRFAVNALLLGALSAADVLPIPVESYEQAIRSSGVAVEANIAAFRAGRDSSNSYLDVELIEDKAGPGGQLNPSHVLPDAVASIVEAGALRVRDFQDSAYAQLYRVRLNKILEVDAAPFELTKETARHLALRMSFEDIIRVADLKCRPERFRDVWNNAQVAGRDPAHIVEFLKPGVDEISAVLPYRIGFALRAWARQRGWLRKRLPLRVKSTTIFGFLQLRLLASLRRFRPVSLRFQEEQLAIEKWLSAILEAAVFDRALALEIAKCANLIKGYGDTLEHGNKNYQMILDLIIQPTIFARAAGSADTLRKAREGALADPEGRILSSLLPAKIHALN